MRSRNKGEKGRKDCKSAQKRSVSKKNQLYLYINRDMDQISKTPSIFPRYRDKERSGARSQQSSRKSQRKHSIDLLMTNKRNNLDQWMESQLKVQYKQKPNKNNFQVEHVIGKGGFGKVWRIQDKKTGHPYAMKEMSKAVILTKKSMESVSNQREFLTRVKHKFIVNMRQAFQDRENLYLVMDLMTGGDLRYHICKKHKFTEQQTRFFAACIVSGLQYLHSKRIIHRDIKPENLVLDDKGYIHLTDLGIAKCLKNQNFTDTSGTPGYMAPQVMCRQNHSFQVDFYALGVILYELMMGRRPYIGRSRKQTVVKKVDIPEGWSVQAADFINKLIQRKPMMRLGWGGPQEVRNHSWLRNIPWEILLSGTLESPFRPFSKYNPTEVKYQPTKEDQQLNYLIKQNKILLRKSSVQKMFLGYTFDDSIKQNQNHTTSSELGKRKQEGFNC